MAPEVRDVSTLITKDLSLRLLWPSGGRLVSDMHFTSGKQMHVQIVSDNSQRSALIRFRELNLDTELYPLNCTVMLAVEAV